MLDDLLNSLPFTGHVEWIGIRPTKHSPMDLVKAVEATVVAGLVNDHYAGRSGKRQVSLLQAEHIPVIAALVHQPKIDPVLLRRNLVISGLNLLALKGHQFQIGHAILEFTGLCHPCSRMQDILGEGGYNAVRGHGGITARVLESGLISQGDAVKVL